MPIIDLQRRLREVGRIRIGEQVPTKTGKRRPAKLSQFRLTTHDEQAIRAAASLYGGEPRPWADSPTPGQWELYTTSTSLPVIIPPAATALSQWYELWSGGGCVRRCDGERNVIADDVCACDAEARECKITTRLNVILRELPGLGVWRLETHGYYAATELTGVVEVCQSAITRGQLLPAVLGLQQRQSKRIVGGKSETLNYAVPTLDVALAPASLGVVLGSPALGPTPTPIGPPEPVQPPWQPIPEQPAELNPGPSVPERIEHPQPPPKRSAGKRAAEPIPATGLPLDGDPMPEPELIPPEPPSEHEEEVGYSQAQMAKLRACYGELGIRTAIEQREVSAKTLGLDALESHSSLNRDEMSHLIDNATRAIRGELVVLRDEASGDAYGYGTAS